MAWWPFKRKPKHTPAHDGGTVEVMVNTPAPEPSDYLTEAQRERLGAKLREIAADVPAVPTSADRARIGREIRALADDVEYLHPATVDEALRTGSFVQGLSPHTREVLAERFGAEPILPGSRTVEAYLASQERPAPASVEEYVAKQREFVEDLAAVTETNPALLANPDRVRLTPVDHTFRPGDQVLTANGFQTWTVESVAEDGTVLVRARDSRGRLQARYYHPSKIRKTN